MSLLVAVGLFFLCYDCAPLKTLPNTTDTFTCKAVVSINSDCVEVVRYNFNGNRTFSCHPVYMANCR